ncbi:MAG TPA: sigma-70 family RNA polymerase sigma factor [Candidatus Paceibacterota bacterium]|nr:sigma-70 family RNA polymerase sigma factor [Candidatus Paceibacterota bacterium]
MIDGEEKLIKDAIRGSSSAFGALYDHYQPMIYRFVLVKVGSREEAEDITHQVFLSAWQNVRTYKHRGHPFSSWLYQIARNQVIDHYRSKKSDVSIDVMDPEYFAAQASMSADLMLKLDVEKVRRAVAELKPDYQDVIIMRFIEDLPLKETAAAMGKTEGAVKLIQHRAIKELQQMLGTQAYESFRNASKF